MDIFEQADAFTPNRAVLQEEEEAASSCAGSYLRPALCVWNRRLSKQLFPDGMRCEILIIATCPTSCALMRAIGNKQLLGAVLGPGVSLAGNSLVSGAGDPLASDKVCPIYTLRQAPPATAALPGSALHVDVLLVCCQYEVARERAPVWARSVLEQISCSHAVFLGAMAAEQFRGQGDASQEELIFALRTSASQQRQLQAGARGPVPLLPTGTVVGGLPASLLSYCQVHGASADLLVIVEMVLEGRPALLEALAAALGQLLRSRGLDAAAAAMYNGAVLAAARKGLGTAAVCDVYV
ncbi:hypothetical protein Vafri_19553 [Volvox africanus]|uniref:Proteasome assembly chaperone 1 n=2 Tax=Volvox africanus TaxID=51714 RepID=A0A8J4F8S1_9CHLO|nr:hypothetical protein Vafri_19553 [Volvox africanus]